MCLVLKICIKYEQAAIVPQPCISCLCSHFKITGKVSEKFSICLNTIYLRFKFKVNSFNNT